MFLKSKIKIIIATVVILLILAGIWWLVRLIWLKPASIPLFYERVMIEYALKDPETTSSTGIMRQYGLKFFDDDLTSISKEAKDDLYDVAEHELKILQSYNIDRLNEKDRLSRDILEWYLKDTLDGKEYIYHGFPINNYFGVHKTIVEFMCNSHQIKNKKDVENYIERLSKIGDKLDQAIDLQKEGERQGIIPPWFLVYATIEDIRGFKTYSPETNVLYLNLKEKLEKIDLSDEKKNDLLEDTKKELLNSVYPAYQRLIDYYNEILPKAGDYIGMSQLPKGSEYYEYCVRHNATFNISPEEAFNTAVSEIQTINKRLDELNTKGEADRNPQQKSIKTIADCQGVIDDMYKKMDRIFITVPKARVEVQNYPYEGDNRGEIYQYNPSDIENSRPATIYISKWFESNKPNTLRWILYHEGVPGHHLQLSIQRELKGLPTFRKIIPFGAFTEGWATYAEHLPWELGLVDDKYGEAELLKDRRKYAIKVAIDTGINYKGWTREETVDFVLKNLNYEWNSDDVEAMIRYYTVCPGSSCTYFLGSLKINQLRERAQTELGTKFDIREFHDVVLRDGSIPISILEKNVDKYIKERKSGL